MSNFPPPPPPEPPGTGQPMMPDHQARQWAMLCHISALSGFLIPFGHLGGPLLFWLLKRNEHPLVDQNGKEAVNFQISMTIYAAISAVLVIVVIGILLLIALGIFWIVVVIIASIRANNGEAYRYPLTIRFIR